MKVEPTQLHARKIRNLEALKSEIARCLEEEVSLKANDKNARVSSGSIGRSPNNPQSPDEADRRRTKSALDQGQEPEA